MNSKKISETLRNYQATLCREITLSLKNQESCLVQLSTGGGKTIIASYIVARCVELGYSVFFVVHRDYLISQTSDTFKRFQIDHGIISAKSPLINSSVQVASVQTLVNRLQRVKKPDIIIFDECHRSVASTYQQVREFFPESRVVGFTASPERLDGKALGVTYDRIISGPTMGELIESGHLCDFDIYAPDDVDVTQLKRDRNGEFNSDDSDRAVNNRRVTGSAVAHYQKHLSGKRAVAFCSSIVHSQAVAAEFNSAGIPAAHIDGTTDAGIRRKLIDDFNRGEILVLTNVNLFTEGFDVPMIEGVIFLRPSNSLVFYLQAVGRALRPAQGKTKAIILDHVMITETHGWPSRSREWTLDGREIRTRSNPLDEDAPLRCDECHKWFRGVSCSCGAIRAKNTRVIQEVEGELKRLNREEVERRHKELSKQKRREEAMAETLQDFLEIEKSRGYKQGWGLRRWKLRSRK